MSLRGHNNWFKLVCLLLADTEPWFKVYESLALWMVRVSCELRLRDYVAFTTNWREVVYHAYPLENCFSCRRFFTRIPKGGGNPRASVLNCLMLQMSGVWDVITLFSLSVVWL